MLFRSNRLAIRTGWDDSVLRHRYYSGLAEHIKDIMGQQGQPATLEQMKQLAHSIDSRHWEHLREKSRAGRNKSNHSDKPDNKNKPDDKGKTPASNNNNNQSHIGALHCADLFHSPDHHNVLKHLDSQDPGIREFLTQCGMHPKF